MYSGAHPSFGPLCVGAHSSTRNIQPRPGPLGVADCAQTPLHSAHHGSKEHTPVSGTLQCSRLCARVHIAELFVPELERAIDRTLDSQSPGGRIE